MRVYSYKERSYSEIPKVAIAITIVSKGQRHVGIFHKSEDQKQVSLLHFAWHHQLINNEKPDPYYAWIELPIHPLRARQVAARCRQVFGENRGRLTYAFSSPNDCLDSTTGAYLFGPNRYGLTCATFVMAVFQIAGINLLDFETWPPSREGDEIWKNHIIECLQDPMKTQPPASNDHIQALRAESNVTTRFRPEDVAGAGALDFVPGTFSQVDPIARAILEKLEREDIRHL